MPRFDSQRVTALGRFASVVIAFLSAGANDSCDAIIVIDDIATWANVTPSFDGSGSDGDVEARP